MAKKFELLRAEISPEMRTDMYISTLGSHIAAMGGKLEVLANFPEGTVKINNFSDLG
jgi:hypothetical protein